MPSTWTVFGMSYSHNRVGIMLDGKYNNNTYKGKNLPDEIHTKDDGAHSAIAL